MTALAFAQWQAAKSPEALTEHRRGIADALEPTHALQ
jgi:hypothetical protein